jgi:hypothetical protein
MVLLLSFDVFDGLLDLRNANTKSAISFKAFDDEVP